MTKKALLVGINKSHIPGAELRGCVNDVQGFLSLLVERFGFAHQNIVILTDLQATTKAIRVAVSNLVRHATHGDVLLFHYSGHGSNAPDRSGDEAEYRDEMLCPADLDWRAPLTLDSLNSQFNKIPKGINLTVTLDCGFSGTNTRAMCVPDAPTVARYLPSPWDLIAGESGRKITGKFLRSDGQALSSQRRGDVGTIDAPRVQLSACRPIQTAYDACIGGNYYGVLTHYLIAAIKRSNTPLNYRDLHGKMVSLIKEGGFDQVPQLFGPKALLEFPFLAPMSEERRSTVSGQGKNRGSKK
jgi:hypothetical protein